MNSYVDQNCQIGQADFFYQLSGNDATGNVTLLWMRCKLQGKERRLIALACQGTDPVMIDNRLRISREG